MEDGSQEHGVLKLEALEESNIDSYDQDDAQS